MPGISRGISHRQTNLLLRGNEPREPLLGAALFLVHLALCRREIETVAVDVVAFVLDVGPVDRRILKARIGGREALRRQLRIDIVAAFAREGETPMMDAVRRGRALARQEREIDPAIGDPDIALALAGALHAEALAIEVGELLG